MAFCLRGKLSLCCITMPLAFTILLVRILNGDFLVHQVLPVHSLDSLVRCVEISEGQEAVTFAQVVIIASDLRSGDERAKSSERVVQRSFVYHRIKIANEKLRTDFDRLLLVSASFVDSDRLAIKPDLIHYAGSIVCILLRDEFDEAVSLVRLRDTVFREMDVDDAAGLQHQLPYESISHTFIKPTDIHRRLFVLFPATIISS